MPASHFRVDRKHFWNEAFKKRLRHDNRAIFSLTEFLSNRNPKRPVIVAFLNPSSVV